LATTGLTATEAGLLDRLAPFTALWKIGAHTALADHVIADHEWSFCDTDTAMRGTATHPAGAEGPTGSP
jgi:hypothetical protein